MSTDNEPNPKPEDQPTPKPEDQPITKPENEDVAEGVTNEPRGTGDLDQDALDKGKDGLEQAGGGH
ncbi:MAG: hypothetical protein WKF96_01405 [Solirubrobacteraceae bacterium]